MSPNDLQVVISFRCRSDGHSRDELTDLIAIAIRQRLGGWLDPKFLAVGIRVIGEGGETSEMEDEWPPGHITEDVEVADTRPTDNVDSGGRL